MSSQSKTNAEVFTRDQHGISRKAISRAALDVMYTLNRSGFKAYLVGGSVRDLLLGQQPKDFDVATDATPEQVKQLFRNSRVVGRRFKIAHVRIKGETVEVTTFRAHHTEASSGNEAQQTHAGLLVRDNVYGSLEEDAVRRDFTINAMYYSVEDFNLHVFCKGLDDLNNRTLRLIGDPETRYREDPVRMLRAIRFKAKLHFDFAPETEHPLPELAYLIQEVAPARLFDELLKLLLNGLGVDCWKLLKLYGFIKFLLPATAMCLEENPAEEKLILQALANTDLRVREGKPVTPAFIYAALLWPAVRKKWQNETQDLPGIAAAGYRVVMEQNLAISIPKRFAFPMREIWEFQLRLPKNQGKRAAKLVEQKRFRAAYDFLLLREAAGEIEPGLGQWWTDYQQANGHERKHLVHKKKELPNKKRKSRRRKPGRPRDHKAPIIE